jgi:hypothetical protein
MVQMPSMDGKLVAKGQQYEVSYFARKHRISAADARSILQRAGRSRDKGEPTRRSGEGEMTLAPAWRVHQRRRAWTYAFLLAAIAASVIGIIVLA